MEADGLVDQYGKEELILEKIGQNKTSHGMNSDYGSSPKSGSP
jgi:hypothetical protein